MIASSRQTRKTVPFPVKETVRGSQLLTPQNLEAEQSALGAMLMEPEALVRARSRIVDTDFYRVLHTKIYNAIVAVFDSGQGVDVVSVAEELRRTNELDNVGGSEYLSGLYDACPSSANIDSYLDIVFNLSQKRKFAVLSEELQQRAFNGNSSGEIRLWLSENLAAFAARDPKVTAREWTAADLMLEHFEPARCAIENLLPIGLTIFAGAPKIGKSWMSYAFALAVASGGFALGKYEVEKGEALYLALEDQPRRLQDRLGKLLTGPNGTEPAPENLRIYCDWPRMDEGGLDQMEAWLVAHPKCRLVIVDTLQKIRPRRDGSNFYEEDYAHFAALKRVADTHEVAVVVVLHTSKRETTDALQSIAGSTGQVGAADAILVLNRGRGGSEGKLYCVGRDIDEREIPLRWTAEVGTWTELDEEEVAEATISAERQEVLDILKNASWPMAPLEIAEMLDKKSGAIRRLLFSMKAAGEVQVTENGKYDLPIGSKERSPSAAEGRAYGPPTGSAPGRVTGVTDENPARRSAYRGNAGNAVTPVTRVIPPPPPWLADAAMAHAQSLNIAQSFWDFWHDRYLTDCDKETFDACFDGWVAGTWPEPS